MIVDSPVIQAGLVSFLVVALLYVLVFYVLRSLFRRTSFELGSVTLRVSEVPALIVAILSIFNFSVYACSPLPKGEG